MVISKNPHDRKWLLMIGTVSACLDDLSSEHEKLYRVRLDGDSDPYSYELFFTSELLILDNQ